MYIYNNNIIIIINNNNIINMRDNLCSSMGTFWIKKCIILPEMKF